MNSVEEGFNFFYPVLINPDNGRIYLGKRTIHLSRIKRLSKINTAIYCINNSEISGEPSRENMLSSHVKITCYFYM